MSSVSVIVAERTPEASGRNVTAIVQFELTAMAALQLGAEKLKSLELAPAKTTLEIWSGAVPELVTVMLEEVLVPCVMGATAVPKVKVPGTSVTAGACGRPVPLKETDSEGGAALSVNVKAALRVPVADGVKVINTVQD